MPSAQDDSLVAKASSWRAVSRLRLASPFIALTVLLASAMGCGESTDGDVVLEFWAMGAEGELVQEVVADFEREHPGIRVEVQQQPWTSAHEKFLTAYAGRSTPDVAQLGNTWIAEMEALNALVDLGPYIEESATVEESDYFSGAWDTNVVDGKTWGVPWYVDTRILFYRPDLLRAAGYEAVPETWAEWEAAMQAVQERADEDQYAILLPLNEFEPPLILALNTSELLRDGSRYGNFRSDGFRRAFEFYIGLFEDGLAPKATNTEISNVYQEFARGTFAFYVTGPWNIGEFQRRLPEGTEWATAPFPGPDAGTPGVSVAGGASLVIFEGSPHKEEAWTFLEYLSRPDVQVRFNELSSALPPRESAWVASGLAEDPYAAAFREQLRHVRPTPKVPEQERIAQAIREMAEKVVQGQMTVDEALVELDRDADRALEKRRWLLDREAEDRQLDGQEDETSWRFGSDRALCREISPSPDGRGDALVGLSLSWSSPSTSPLLGGEGQGEGYGMGSPARGIVLPGALLTDELARARA